MGRQTRYEGNGEKRVKERMKEINGNRACADRKGAKSWEWEDWKESEALGCTMHTYQPPLQRWPLRTANYTNKNKWKRKM